MMQFNKMTGCKTTHHSNLAGKLISLGICVAMVGSIAGCTIGGKKSSTETVPADAPYFAMKELEFYETKEGEEANIISMTPCGDQVALLIQVYDNGGTQPLMNSGTTGESVSIRSANVAAVDETAAEPTDPTEADVDADTTEPTDTTTEPTDTTDASSDTDIMPEPDYYMGTTRYIVILYDETGEKTAEIELGDILGAMDTVVSMAVNNDGNFVVLVQSFDEVNYTQSNKLYTIDNTGTVIGTPVIVSFSDEYFYPYQMVMDASGNLYFGGYGMDAAMVVVTDGEGKTLYEVEDSSLNGGLYLIDGVVYTDGYNTEGNDYKMFFYPIVSDKDNHLGEKIDVTKLFMGSSPFPGSSGLYVNSASGIYSYDLETEEKTEVLLWKDTDVDKGVYAYGAPPVVLSEDAIFLQGSTYTATSYETKIAVLIRQDENPNVGKEIIRVAGVGISWDSTMQSGVYNFNTESKDYRIEVTDYAEDFDYSAMETYEDYLAAYSEMNQKMYTEMIAGTGPDVIYATQGMSFSLFESKDLLVDLYTLMEGDDSFNKEDYIPSVLKLCETDGHLYKIPTTIMIQGFAGAKSVIGDRTGWTVDEFNEMVNSLPSGVMPLANYTQNALLTASLNASMIEFVDVSTGKVNFDSEEFCQLLDLAKTYGTADTGDEENYEDYVDEWTLAQNGELALMTCNVYDPSSYNMMATVFGEDVSIVGFPSSTKAGPLCAPTSAFAISSESGSIDGAWSFVKSFYTEEAQNKIFDSYSYGIPIMTSVFEKQIDRAVHPEDYDDGEQIYYGDMYGGTEPMSEESAQAYRDLINSLDTLTDSDQQILSIIMEEVPAYFNGQKTDQAVAALIQNRVQTLVNERQ